MQVPTGALAVLRGAEGDLRKLIQEALQQGRYQDVSAIAALADAIARLSGSEGEAHEADPETPSRRDEPPPAGSPTRRPLSARAYPRFERNGDQLVKFAWSKRNRAEYEHRAPREVVQVLIKSIEKKKGEGAKFEAPEVLPLQDAAHRDVPSYQAYLALAWLRQEGVIVKHGRDKYVLKPGISTRERIAELWDALPQR